MIIKHKLYKIALVSMAMVLMFVSIASAFVNAYSLACGSGRYDHSSMIIRTIRQVI